MHLLDHPTRRSAPRSSFRRGTSRNDQRPDDAIPGGVRDRHGEAVPVAGGFRGRALNLAARLCGAAKAGEILATREAIHLAGQMDGVHVEDRGVSSFKNIAEPVGVMRITGEGEDTAHWFAEHFAPPVPTRRVHGRRRLVIAALATLLVAAVAVPLLDSQGSASTQSVELPGCARFRYRGTRRNSGFRGATRIDRCVGGCRVGDTPDAGTVTRIDPSEREVRDSIPVGENPTGIAVGFGAVWVVESGGPSVSRISPDTNEVVDRVVVGNGPSDIAVGDGSVWVTNRFDGTVSRIDPNGGTATKTIPIGLDPRRDHVRVRGVGGTGGIEHRGAR